MQRTYWPLKMKQCDDTEEDTESVGLHFPCDYHEPKSHTIFLALRVAKKIIAEYDERLTKSRAEEKVILSMKTAEDGDTLNIMKELPALPEIHWQCQLEGCGKTIWMEIDALRKSIKGVEEGTGGGNIEWRGYN